MAEARFGHEGRRRQGGGRAAEDLARALENEAPYFVDYVSQLVDETYAGRAEEVAAVDVYTTLDLQLQRIAQEALGDGIAQVDKQLAARKRRGPPKRRRLRSIRGTGDILAFVGGRAYNQSQFDRVVAAHRQPGSVFKPFVYLAAFENGAEDGHSEFTPATVVVDEPTTFKDGQGTTTPRELPERVRRSLRFARARPFAELSPSKSPRRRATTASPRCGSAWAWARPASRIPSMALGVFEATPLDMATAYTIFANHGKCGRSARSADRGERPVTDIAPGQPRTVARPDTTYLVESMMRSVLNEGTGRRPNGRFTLDAGGKTGTTNDLRDAWFIGFTPELLTAVWVGLTTISQSA